MARRRVYGFGPLDDDDKGAERAALLALLALFRALARYYERAAAADEAMVIALS
jgi:hypothetical protein